MNESDLPRYNKNSSFTGGFIVVRVERIELSSQVWKTCILTVVLHPQAEIIITNLDDL